MATEKAKEISKKMMEAAKTNKEAAEKLAFAGRTSNMELGWINRDMREKNQFELLGFKENEWFNHLRIGRASYYRYIGLAEAFHEGISKADFIQMRAENADHLAKLEPPLRFRKDLVKAAKEMTEEEFEKLLVKHRAKDEDAEEDELVVTLKIRLTEGQRKVINDTFAWFAEEHELDKDNPAKVLELICAEVRSGEPVVTATMRAVQHLNQARELLGNVRDDRAQKALALAEQVIRMMAAAARLKVDPKKPRLEVVPETAREEAAAAQA